MTTMASPPSIALILTGLLIFLGGALYAKAGAWLGWYLQRKTHERRKLVLAKVAAEEKLSPSPDEPPSSKSSDEGWEKVEEDEPKSPKTFLKNRDWDGVIGFFHPFCNAGGGGERVLWAAIRATQSQWPKAVCVVYTGDHDATKEAILERVKSRFNIHLHPPTTIFLYLSTRRYVLASMYPHFTLLGQSLGSLILAYDAFSLLVPDIFIDTMGYAFTLAFSKFCFPKVPTAAYVHYPTISTDMLESLDSKEAKGLNAGAGVGWKGDVKKKYWRLFAAAYSWVGGNVDVVMTNSSWTQAHIRSLWGPSRRKRQKTQDVKVLFPPVAVKELEKAVQVSEESEKQRQKVLLYIAQFRPEKNHNLVLRAMAEFLHSGSEAQGTKLVLIGSVRDSDDRTRVYELRLLAHELKLKDMEDVEFVCDAPWSEVLMWLGKSSVGVNAMWNEHFGIGVVEYQAAGLISVVNDSGGPKEDIVVEFDSGPTGFHASTATDYAAAFAKALSLSSAETLAMRQRARESANRFTEEAFAGRWEKYMEELIQMHIKHRE